MSIVLNKGKVNLGHWRYPAFAMESCLDKFINEKTINTSKIPKGVYKELLKFFDIALDAISKNSNPFTRITNFKIAIDAIGKTDPDLKMKDLEAKLNNYSQIYKELTSDKNLDAEQITRLKELRDFFSEIYKTSDSKKYESSVSSKLLL